MLVIQDLQKRFQAVEAVSRVSFAVNRGEVFGLLGSNGAGKSTALACVAGMLDPDGGKISLFGEDLARATAGLRRRLGMAPQALAVSEGLKVAETFRLFAALYGVRPEERTGGLADRFGLGECWAVPVKDLSGGQQQRLNVALAFVGWPELVILDEPEAGLDPWARDRLREHLRQGRQEGRAALLSTHDISEAAALCDRVGVMRRGRLVAMGRPTDLIRAVSGLATVRIEMGRPMTGAELAGLGERDGLVIEGCRVSFQTADPGREVAHLMRILQCGRVALIRLEVSPLSLEEAVQRFTEGAA